MTIVCTWVYIQSEKSLYTVGFYSPEGAFVPESDHNTPEEAAERVHYLNGGDPITTVKATTPYMKKWRMSGA